jgi:uncharacterized integral membrane protein
MEFNEQGQAKAPTGKSKRELSSGMLAAIIAILIYSIPFVLLNTHHIEVNFVLFSAHVSVIFALLLMVALGFILGFVVSRMRERKKAK